MGQSSSIEWTDATWNPVRGCSRISSGCGGANHLGGCYAEQIAARFSDPGQPFHGFAERTPHGVRWTGKMALVNEHLTDPFHWRDPRQIFVNSMSDLFHENLPMADIAEVFGVMAVAGQVFLSGAKTQVYGYHYDPPGSDNKIPLKSFGQKYGPHIFQVLTKRSSRMRDILLSKRFREAVASAAHRHAHDRVCAGGLSDSIINGSHWPLPNVWLGVSVEDQNAADHRVPDILETPTVVRFLSCEPLLGAVDLSSWLWGISEPCEDCPKDADCICGMNTRKDNLEPSIDWVICGGESGKGPVRPMNPAWPRGLRDQCVAAGVPFFFKQWGEYGEPTDTLSALDWPYHKDHDRTHWFDNRTCVRPIEDGWSDKYHSGTVRAQDPEVVLFRTPEFLDQVSRCRQQACRENARCMGNFGRAAATRIGKKAAGRLLDGRTWDEYPTVVA